MIETSISWIYLYADQALKLKKPVDLGFLDFSSLEKRRWACDRELAFNLRTAPDVYRAVHAVTRAPGGGLALDGSGPVVEWILAMRRFDETAMLASRLDAVDGAFAEDLGRRIARFHAEAAPGAAGGGAQGLRFVVNSNAKMLREAIASPDASAAESLLAATEEAFAIAAPLLDRRLAAGFARCCHGDLHLGNILLEGGSPLLFDCIEFNDGLREIDVLYDIAFLLMDLVFRGAPGAANRLMNGWLDQSARHFGEGVWEGLAALPLFLSVRAAVRAHVTGLEGRSDEAGRYVAAARAHLRPTPPVLVAIGGLSGSGKTTLGRALAPGLGMSPGAVVLRSDEIRKRQWRCDPTERAPPAAYTGEASLAVYAELFATARACLAAGRAVIADAVFLRSGERDKIEALALEAGFRFEGIWLEASPAALRDRIERRRGDASDADASVLAMQLGQDPGVVGWTRASDPGSPDGVRRIEARLGLPERDAG